MSNCRDSYCNYGSYLRSRGYDKQICKLVDDIENGNINNGAVNPNSNGNGAVVNGSLIVKSAGQANPPPSNSRMQEGLIYSFGGQLGSSGEFINNYDLGMQMYNGTRINGPIIQTANNSHVKATAQGSSVVTHVNTNIFKGDTHIFTNDGADTNVIIKGNLSFDGSLVQLPDTIETSLTLQAPATHNNEMLTIFHGATEAQGFDIVDVWIDGSGNIVPPSGPPTGTKNWLQRLAFAIDGDLSANQFTTGGYNGATAVHGHTRILRGATVLNPCHDPSTDNTIDISYSLNDISDVALDVYGRVRVFEGPTYNGLVKSAPEIDLSGSSVNAAKISMYNDGSLTLNLNANDGIINGNSSGDGIKIRDVSNIRFLDNTEIFVGNSLDISSDKVEFLHGDVHIAENLSVSGNIVSIGTLNAFTAAAIDTLNVETKLACNGDASFNDNVTIGNNLQIDGALQVGSTGTGNILGTIQTPNQSFITDLGTLNNLTVAGNITQTSGKIVQSANQLITNELNSIDIIQPNSSGVAITTSGSIACSDLNASNIYGQLSTAQNNINIDAGAIDATPIGDNTRSTGKFTTLSATGGITGTLQTAAQPSITSVGTLASVDIDGGAIDATPIGDNTRSTGKFTTLSTTGNVDIQNAEITFNNDTNNASYLTKDDLSVGANLFSVVTSGAVNNINIGKSNTSLPARFYSSTTYLDLEANGNDLEIKGHGGNPKPGLKVQKFGLGVTPEETQSYNSSSGMIHHGSATLVRKDSKFDGGITGISYHINDIVRALKKFGILEQ